MERIQAAIQKAKEARGEAAPAAAPAPAPLRAARPAARGRAGGRRAGLGRARALRARPGAHGAPPGRDLRRRRSRPCHLRHDAHQAPARAPGERLDARSGSPRRARAAARPRWRSNLAFSLAHQADLRTVLVDLDLRRPAVARELDLPGKRSVGAAAAGRGERRRDLPALRRQPRDRRQQRADAPFGRPADERRRPARRWRG